MAIILTQSAAITKSKLKNGFNGDNFNLNGRVVPSDEADRGYKAAGNVKPPFTALLASGNSQGFSAGAVAAFNDYCADIDINRYDAQPIFERYFNDMASVVEKCNIPSASLSISSLCIYDDCVLAARDGGCHILRFSQGELYEIALAEDENSRGFQVIDVVYDGDIFAIISSEASADLDYDAIVNILDSGNDVKVMIKDLYKSLSAHCENDCSAIVVKVESDTKETYSAKPVVAYGNTGDENIFDAEPADDSFDFGNEPEIEAEEAPVNGKNSSAKKSILKAIPIIILVIILAITAALYFATRPKKPTFDDDTTDAAANNIVLDIDETETEMDFNGSSGMQDVEDNGPDIDEENEENEADEPTTRRREPETEAPTRAPSTNAPDTTVPDETTTASDETTASSDETTTASDETTTASDETTTSSDETTNSSNETTNSSNETTANLEEPTTVEEPVAVADEEPAEAQ